MFFLKTDRFLKSKIVIGYVKDYYHYIKQRKQFLCTLKANDYINYVNNKTYLCSIFCCNKDLLHQRNGSKVQIKVDVSHLLICNNKFSTLVKDPNVFGNLSNATYERIKMDKAEEEEEEFAKNAKLPKREIISYRNYLKLIKSHLDHNNLALALQTLDLMKENDVTPCLFIYRLLISAFAKQGDITQCFKLFRELRSRGYVPPASTYYNLINACAEANNKDKALEHLIYLQNYVNEKNITLNEKHYTALITAYSRHNKILTAFKIADEARDKDLSLEYIYSALLQAAISDINNGLKYAVILWHKMKINNVKPNIFHYNLLLKAIRETKFGDLKVNDILIPESVNTQIQVITTGTSDLLSSPPVITASLSSLFKKSDYVTSNKCNSLLDITNTKTPLSINLNEILKENRLYLFGGIYKLLEHMKNDKVYPSVKTLTLILDLLPPTIDAEEQFFKYITKNYENIIDITFFNMLIRKRCMRQQYESAKDVLNKIQSYHLEPNIITFGVLAIGCIKYSDGVELLNQMDAIGYSPNYRILETLLYNACDAMNFTYVSYLMKYISSNKIKPSRCILSKLEKFELVLQKVLCQDSSISKTDNSISMDYHKFKINFENWKEEVLQNKKNLKY